MSLKKDFMEKVAESLVKMDKEEKKEFLKYVIDSMGQSFFDDLSKDEKTAVMSEALIELVKRSGLTNKDEQKELIVSLTKTMVDCFLGELKAEERGEMMASAVVQTVQRVGPEIKTAMASAIKQLMDASPTIAEAFIRVLQDATVRTVLIDFVKGLLKVLMDLLRSMAIEVFGYLKESGPEVMEFLKEAARTALKALLRIGIELLKKAIEVISELMQAGGKGLIQTKDWIDRVMASEEMRSIRGTMEKMVDERAEAVKKVMADGVKDLEELAERTKIPRETLRNILLKLWERGEIEMDALRPGGPRPSA